MLIPGACQAETSRDQTTAERGKQQSLVREIHPATVRSGRTNLIGARDDDGALASGKDPFNAAGNADFLVRTDDMTSFRQHKKG